MAIGFIILSLSWVVLYKFVPVKWTPLMLKRSIQNIEQKEYKNSRAWVDIENISPVMVREKYSLYDNKICTGDEAAECVACMKRRMESSGYEVVVDRGDFRK